jgi:hypothetical protein
MIDIPKMFTPNTEKGGNLRYKLYRRGKNYSATPDGPIFRAKWAADDCGLNCMCAAVITDISKRGLVQLKKAKIIDGMGRETSP